jgi:aryl sulfotransferase
MEASAMEKSYRTWLIDSDRWRAFRPRSGDVVVATYPKSGTTWMQRILSLLIFRSGEPVALDSLFPWLEVNRRPIEEVVAGLEAQEHRRSVKTHVPFDAVPKLDSVKFIHVARDGRDVAMSYHDHCMAFRPAALARMDAVGLADPTVGKPYPRVDPSAAAYFHNWLTVGAIDGQPDGTPYLSYFAYEKSFFDSRSNPQLLFVHYNDLRVDLVGEMRRIVDFIGADIPSNEIATLAGFARFDSMSRDAAKLVPEYARNFGGSTLPFINKGGAGRWRGVFQAADLALFEKKLRAAVPEPYADWLLAGRIASGGIDPSDM